MAACLEPGAGALCVVEPMKPGRSHRDRLSHLTAAWRRGEVGEAAFRQAMYRTLEESCMGCREVLPTERPTRLDEVSEPVARSLAKLEKLVEGDGGWDAALMKIARWRRRSGRERVNVELAAALLVRARDALPADPERSGRWAWLAAAVAGYENTPRHRERLAQALAYQGNAVRAAQTEGLAAAEPWFESGRSLLRKGAGSAEVGAEVDRLHATLLKDQRRFPAAVHLFLRSLCSYAALGDQKMVARTALSLALTHFLREELGQALDLARLAHAWSVKASANDLRFQALIQLASYAEERGEIQYGRRLLDEALAISDRPRGPGVDAIVHGLDRVLAVRDGSPGAFDELWILYRDRFADGCPYMAVGLLVDMARLSQIQQRYAEMPRIAQQIERLRAVVPQRHEQVRLALRALRPSSLL